MSDSAATDPGDRAARHRLAADGAVRRVFVGDRGLRAGWSVLLFAAIYQTLEISALALVGRFVSLDVRGPIPLSLAFLQESCEVLAVFLATLAMARIENRPLLSYGYTEEHRLIRLVSGALWGFLCLSALIGVLGETGLLVLDGPTLNGFLAWKYALGWALLFLAVGVFEESLLRGYLQYTLTRGIGFWWAALLLSTAFALGHAGNSGESMLGLAEVGAGGLIFCLSLWYTKSLWWAVGCHAGWDWGQSYFYGTANSGLVTKGHLLASHPSGNPLWSGGTTGPEGSLLILPLLILMATGMWIWWGLRRPGARKGRGSPNGLLQAGDRDPEVTCGAGPDHSAAGIARPAAREERAGGPFRDE